ncbi:putative ribonuclease R [Spiroplasma kunkelii CR2-3x]|uniref:Ribonuclease R n=1 Tax=Spiroplasma kunkelii CR2-3x TaxID=273035 RepID=A0A0K2JJL4_SPIKU|nr:ribonuclease R [Spiroplasma kunkelii]ALA98441.1 putative ribonuclease R [Spiroplasma kunkelii CR2-3x]
MHDRIVAILKKQTKPIDTIELKQLLDINKINDNKMMLKVLVELENDNIIGVTQQNRFYYFDPKIYLRGVISINKKGFGFIKISENQKEYYVKQDDLNNALDQDQVLFILKKQKNINNYKKAEAQVIKVLKRNNEYVVGVIKKNRHKQKYLEILNNKLMQYSAEIINLADAIENTIVKGIITNINSKNNLMQVKIIEIIGNTNQVGVDVLAILHEFNIRTKFNEETLNEAKQIKQDVDVARMLADKSRRDLQAEMFVTIDGNDSKDFDDAILVKKNQNGNYLLLVAIADVAHYVPQNSYLDKEAFDRGCSVYLIDRVVPMLPEKLSNGICSLNPFEPRLTLICEMEINKQGHVVNSSIYEAITISKVRLTYDEVNKLFCQEKNQISGEIAKMLFLSQQLYQILVLKKEHDGVVDFDLDEQKFIVDKNGKIKDIVVRERADAEKLIESFMIRANETVAETIYWMDLPFVYRVHDKPKPKKLFDLYTQLSYLGLNIKGKLENIHSKDLQQILNKLKDKENFKVISALVLRSMEKAKYSAINDGHFGLASRCYTHFTSPIRRYPDLVVHRLLKEYLFQGKVKITNLEQKRTFVSHASQQSSLTELRAMECEREVDKMKEVEYMEDKIGYEYNGIIAGVTSFGIFVELSNTIEGLIHITDLKNDYYVFDEKNLKLIGERKRKEYFLGKKVRIKVKKASKKLRQIDFELVD